MLVFLFKSMVCLSIMFGLYKLLLGSTTFFRTNHATLILCALVSVVAPFVEVPVGQDVATVGFVDEVMFESFSFEPTETTVNARQSSLTWQNALALIYIIGVAYCLMNIIRSAVRIMLVIRRTPAYRKEKDYTLLLLDDDSVSPYSFGRYVIMSRSDYEANGRAILAHELCHVSHHHSFSVMLMNLLSSLLWLNPIVWLVREELLLVCEYEADTAVINQGIDAKQYQLLLIKKAVSPSRYTIANSLNHSSLKQRITMMRKSKSTRLASLGYVGIALAAAMVLPAFAHKDLISPIEETLQENLVEELKYEIKSVGSAVEESLEIGGKGTENPATDQILMEENADKLAHPAENKENEEMLVQANEAENAPAAMDLTEQVEQAEPENAVADDDKVYDKCEKLPEFKGGMMELMKYIAQNIKYPEAATEAGKEGRVIVRFIITKTGELKDITVVRGVDADLDAEAVRLIGTMSGMWTPGMQDGKPVNCKFTLPVQFRLS